MDPMFTDAAAALLAGHCPPAAVRAIEAGASADALWSAIAEAGFADALVPEAQDGAGLALADVFGVWALCGQHALPLPLAETMLARALLARAGLAAPAGPVALASARAQADGSRRCTAVPGGRTAHFVLASDGQHCRLLAVASARAEPASFELDATLSWPAAAWDAAPALPALPDLRTLQALVLAAQLAGALMAVFQRTLHYANERQQFGKPIGKFQAIQHQLSVMAEEAFAGHMAAQLACATPGLVLDTLRVAVAKARTGEAALKVAELAHSIHGAIGFTREFDLQLLTRRLHAWRQAAGSESHWHQVLGAALVDGDAALTLDLLRNTTDTPALAA